MNLPKKRIKNCLFIFLIVFLIFFSFTSFIFAQEGSWVVDPQVTEVGKSAERARQFLYWTYTHPPSYTVPVLAQIWGISRNIVYGLFILVLAVTGIFYIIARRTGYIGPVFSGISSPIFGMQLPTLFFRIGIFLIYVTFSYIIILGLIQSSEIFSRFFAERFYGCYLFNIKFASSGTSCDLDPEMITQMEKNYIEFVGLRNTNPLNQESASTGLFLVRLTTFTYNLLTAILILRQVVLWFLLMISPFLAILLPFLFIRNTGYIWIGVFFQWLFYGPLLSLFLSGLVLIWKSGIPYAFNFSRINQPESQVFPTAINILYGGPGQVLSPTNTANYIDTYAEYIISLIMLWVAMFLPWLLLRIFRDYCCDILSQNHASLLLILDKIRGGAVPPPPPRPVAPEGAGRAAIQLPFRKPIFEVKKVTLERLQDISRADTYELARALSLSVSTLSEVARYEMNSQERKQIIETLNRIANPYIIPKTEDRERYAFIKKELEERALKGDRQAGQILSAVLKKPAVVTPVPLFREFPEITAREAIETITQKTQISTEKVREILRQLPQTTVENQAEVLASRVNIPKEKVQQVLTSLPQYAPLGDNLKTFLAENKEVTADVAKRTGFSQDKVEQVLNQFSEATLSTSERIEKVAKETIISSEKIREVLTELLDVVVTSYPQILDQIAQSPEIVSQVAKETLIDKEKVEEVFKTTSSLVSQTLISQKISRQDILKEVSEKTVLPVEKVESVLRTISEIFPQAKLPETFVDLKPRIFEEVSRNREIITRVAEKTSLDKEKVEEVLKTTSFVTSQILSTKAVSKEETILSLAKKTNLSETQVETILKLTSETLPQAAPEIIKTFVNQPEIIEQISQSLDLPKETVKKVLEHVSEFEPTKANFKDQIETVAKETDLPQERVNEILGTVAAVHLEKPEVAKAKVIRRPVVSIEDYEEVRNMWLNHYKLSEIPISEKIKTRQDWIEEDIKRLTNILNLLTSLSPSDKEKGMKEVASTLPFLLLGGFSDVETVVYLKAKLQAAKLVLSQLEEQEKIKEEVKKEEEETLVEIPVKEKEEEPKVMEAEKEKAIDH